MTRNRTYNEIYLERKERFKNMLWSFFILMATAVMMAFCLYASTNKKIMAPIEESEIVQKIHSI